LTLLAAAGFYAYATLRRVPRATEALTAALAALAVVGPGSLDLHELVPPRPWPILAVAALQLGLGLRRRDAGRCLVGAGWLVLAGWRDDMGWPGSCSLRQVIVGLDLIALGLALLAVAELISLAKGGLLPWPVARGKGQVPDPSE